MAPYRQPAQRHWHPDYADPLPPRPDVRLTAWTIGLAFAALAMVPLGFACFEASHKSSEVFWLLAIVELALGTTALCCGVAAASQTHAGVFQSVSSVIVGLGGFAVSLAMPALLWIVDVTSRTLPNIDWSGGAWGRPLRVRGRVLHPRLRSGSDWTKGDRPSTRDLDAPTRAALEALWLHDAQKEHASVPAFSRISWVLAAVGAPAELVEGAHRAAMEEIDHARRCFALAAGYGGRTYSVEPMPDLLVGGLDVRGDPLVTMATESLTDGCLLEDFNADVAGACAAACQEPVVKDVLERIAREERSHADFSWDVLAWLVARREDHVIRALATARTQLAGVKRPTAVSREKAALVASADATRLRSHGRIADAEWAALWAKRVVETGRRADALLLARERAA